MCVCTILFFATRSPTHKIQRKDKYTFKNRNYPKLKAQQQQQKNILLNNVTSDAHISLWKKRERKNKNKMKWKIGHSQKSNLFRSKPFRLNYV